MTDYEIIKWLIEGDAAIRYQAYRDLLSKDKKDLRKRIAIEGWGVEIRHSESARLFQASRCFF